MACAMATSGAIMAQEHLKSLNPAYFDKSTPVGTDFFTHINKGWQEAHPLTAEYSRYGQFNVLNDESERRVKEMSQLWAPPIQNRELWLKRSGPSTAKQWTRHAAMPRVQHPSKPTWLKSRTLPTKGWRTSSFGYMATTRVHSSAQVPWKILQTPTLMQCM